MGGELLPGNLTATFRPGQEALAGLGAESPLLDQLA